MVTSFRTAFMDAMNSSGQSLALVAQGSGISESQLQHLFQHPDTQTNVDDAKKIAAHFGFGLDAFLGDPELQGPIEIVELYNQLPAHLKHQLQAYGQGLLASEDPSEQE